jgi:hypothetical protein
LTAAARALSTPRRGQIARRAHLRAYAARQAPIDWAWPKISKIKDISRNPAGSGSIGGFAANQ